MNAGAESTKPTVSVVMPVYNARAYLMESVTSVLAQTLNDLELILVDDGSDDGSLRLLQDFAARDPRVILLRHAENLGQIRTRNDGIARAAGRYIATMDADDVCHPERLERQVEFLEARPDLFLVGSDATVIDAAGRTLGHRRCEPDPDRLAALLPRRNVLIHSTTTFRNDGRGRYREKMHLAEDYDFYLCLLTRGARLASLQEPLLRYRLHASSLTLSNATRQLLLTEKVQEFYRQRVTAGQDAYEAFDPRPILSQDPEAVTDARLMRRRILLIFSANALPETRRLLRRYFGLHGVAHHPELLLYLAAAYLPPGLLVPVKRCLKSVMRRG